jgi:glycosyltransferase involved in cell wall biosynthesis
MRIVIDALALQVRSAGIAVYTEQLARALAVARPDLELTLFGWPAPGMGNATADDGSWPANVRWQRALLYPLIMGAPLIQLPRLLPLEASVRGAHLFHATNYTTPSTRSTPVVLTVHDLALLRFPELGTPALRRLVGRVGRNAAAARLIIADSEATARDLRELLAIPSAKIRVVHCGCAAQFRPVTAPDCEPVLRRHGISTPYLLHLGTLEPRKNLVRLLGAYRQVLRSQSDVPPLVLAGAPGWGATAVRRALDELQLRDRVHLTGAVPTRDLPALYSAAVAMVFPSLYEGFGLPVLEAMACGTPVVSSTGGSLPELAADAALYVEPSDEAAIADAIATVLRDASVRGELRVRGMARARQFTWARCAERTAAVYDEALRA